MNSQRLSLSSSVFAGRIKKFDTYQHDAQTSQRVPSKPVITSKKPVVQNIAQRVVNVRPQLKSVANVALQENNWPKTVAKPIFRSEDRKATSDNSAVQSTQKLALSVIANVSIRRINVIERQFTPPVNNSRLSRFLRFFKRKNNMTKPQMAFYGLGLVVFMFAGLVSVQTLLTNKQAKEQINVLGEQTFVADEEGVIESTNGSEPAEAEVTQAAISSYRVDPELPRYLRIPSLGVNARIKSTGLTKNGAVDAPKNINDVGWFNDSATPGNAIGSSLLLGHVSGWSAPGVFKKIDKLQAGSRIEIEKGSGEKLVYEVTRGEKIPVSQIDMSKILGTEVAGQHDLKLLTCAGKYNKDTKQYEDRYVVYAKILRE